MPSNIWWAIAAGGALGAVLRFALATRVAAVYGDQFPFGILLANVLGSLAMGLAYGYFLTREVGPGARAFLTVGVLGAFTTFSTFALDAVLLIQRQAVNLAILYVGLSVILSMVAIWIGFSGAKLLAG